MTKAIFTTKPSPAYDDLPESRYHFPSTYLNQVRDTVGDWIIYYKPRRTSSIKSSTGGRQAYFAIARVTDLREDLINSNHYYADISDYIEFARSVPFREGTLYYESALRRKDGGTSKGAFGRAVRPLQLDEFELILRAGFASVLSGPSQDFSCHLTPGLAEDQTAFERPLVESLTMRPIRDAAFAKNIGTAYKWRCAVTGLSIRNGGGRPEIEAAHIRPVAKPHSGPDSIQNGLALSRTIHWMFDRGLISVTDDYQILLAEKKIPSEIRRLFPADGYLHLPDDRFTWPHSQFLQYHRENIFSG